MTRRRLTATGRAPADLVWERYADTARWPVWSPQIRSVQTAGGTRIAPGLTGTVHGPPGISVDFTITAVDDPARTWSWRVRLGPVRLTLAHGVEDDGSTWLDLRGPLPVVVAYAPVAQRALRRLVAP